MLYLGKLLLSSSDKTASEPQALVIISYTSHIRPKTSPILTQKINTAFKVK